MDLSSAQREALDRLLAGKPRTGNLKDDLIAAGKETARRREQNRIDGGRVFEALHELTGSWAIAAYLVDLPKSTVINWFKEVVKADREAETETPETD